MKRIALIALLASVAMLLQSTAFAMGPEHTGSWYNSGQSGHGFSIEYGEDGNGTPLVVVYWYVYDKDGNPVFLTGTGYPDSTGVDITLYAHYGMQFGVFDPATHQEPNGGVARFNFQSANSGTFEYFPSAWTIENFGHSQYQMSITKLFAVTHPNVDPPPTGEPIPVLGLWSGRMTYNRNSVAGNACYDADVQASAFLNGKNDSNYVRIDTVSPDVGPPDIIGYGVFAPEWQAVGAFIAFDQNIEFTLNFDSWGHGQGVWAYENSNCYGEWTFTKD